MPRQRRSSPAARTQTRTASTATHHPQASSYQHPTAASHPAPAQSQRSQPGLFGQMASTAAGVAVGSTIGHTIGAGITSMFGGRSEPAQPQDQQMVTSQQQQGFQEQGRHCDGDARNFTRCLEDNDGNMQICDYYLHQLKACQEASRMY